MDSHFLYHYYEAENGPFRNLSALSDDRAGQIMERLRLHGTAFAGRRPGDYLTVRRQLEERARNLFIGKGGKPVMPYPHYMTLGRCDWLMEWYDEGKYLQIPLDAIDPAVISFTYGDLFPTMRFRDGKPYREQLYLKHEIMEMIERFGWPQQWNNEGKLGPERYIEAQIWDEAPLLPYMESRSGTGRR